MAISYGMKFNPEIFRANDIRGIYGQDFDDEFAFRLGISLVNYLNRKKFLVASDSRGFSGRLAEALMHGIASIGGDVKYLGLSTTPFFNFVFSELGVDGGAMITASHNGPEYGGFKIFEENGQPISLDSGLGVIKDLLSKNNLEVSKYGGQVAKLDRPSLFKSYHDFIIKKSGIKPGELGDIKVKLNSGGEVMEEAGPVLRDLKIQIVDSDWDIAFTFDGDADRLTVFDKDNNKIRSDHIVGLIVENKISFWFKPKLVCDSRFSRGVIEKLDEWHVKHFRSKTGRTFVGREMVKQKADLAGELSGHIFFKENRYKESPLLALLDITKILAKSGKDISTLIKPFQTWFNSGEINTEVSDKQQEMTRTLQIVKEKYPDSKLDTFDGITVNYPDWWFNVRASNTEPMVRMVAEAKSQNLLDEKIREIQEIIGRR